MTWLNKFLLSSIGRKVVMAITGLFLCLFLVIHIAGNFQLFKDDHGASFNLYSKFMTTNPLIKTVSYMLYLSILVHAIQGIMLVLHNKKARPQGYYANKPAANSSWSSRNMGPLGMILLAFIIFHMAGFWYEYKFGTVPKQTYIMYELDGEPRVAINEKEIPMQDQMRINYFKIEKVKDLYKVVDEAFKDIYIVIFYLISMIALSFHLVHGFQSGFQTLGFHHRKYGPVIKGIGWIFSVVIPAGFAAMPIYFFFFSH